MAFCTKCGSEFPESNQFCGKCGSARAANSAAAVAPGRPARKFLAWLALGTAALIVLIAALGSKDSQTAVPKQVSLSADRDLLAEYCKIIPDEDSDNHGIRADGKPWDLTDLAVDAPLQYNLFVLGGKSDLPHVGAALDAALRREPADETISQMCARIGQNVSSPNQSVGLTMAAAADALEHSVRVSN